MIYRGIARSTRHAFDTVERTIVDGKERFIGVDHGRKGFNDESVVVVMDRDIETGVIRVVSERILPSETLQ